MKVHESEYENSEIKSTRLRDKYGLFEGDSRGLAVNDVGGFVYWTVGHKTIMQTSLDGSNTTILLETGKLSVTCKLIHWIIVLRHPLCHLVM